MMTNAEMEEKHKSISTTINAPESQSIELSKQEFPSKQSTLKAIVTRNPKTTLINVAQTNVEMSGSSS
ncbi:unnamed protein product, partial [Iphiclides podalirius]